MGAEEAPLLHRITGLRSDARLWKSSLGSRLWHIYGTSGT
jgi:hypothetical protein